ncbi:hypothetical protein [Nocardioides zeae]
MAASSVTAQRHGGNLKSAIDVAYESLVVVSQMAAGLASTWIPQHGLILSSAAVAAAEDYFRSVLTDVVVCCDVAKRRAGPLSIRLEYVFSASIPDAVRGILETESFSSRANVTDWSKRLLGTKFEQNRSLAVALEEYERVCHIRHSAVHSGGYLSGRNASALGVQPGQWISFTTAGAIQAIVNVVTATIRAYNQGVFEKVVEDWLRDGEMVGSWGADKDAFTALWRALRSQSDIDANTGTLKGNAYLAYLPMQRSFRSRAVAAGAR